MTFYAHTATRPDGTPDPNREHWQRLDDHLHNVSAEAARFAAAFNAADWARLAGLWHDLGKYSAEFQSYLCAAGGADAHLEERPEIAAKVDHSTAGSQQAARELKLFGRLLAYLIAGHHAGLPNGQDATTACLEERLRKIVPSFAAAPVDLFALAANPPRPPGHALTSGYALGFFLRLTFSALVDADWLDTEAFMSPGKATTRARQPQPPLSALRDCLDAHLARFGTAATPVQIARAEVLAACRAAAAQSPGLFALTVPTGGGKTLSSLAFALDHALRHGFDRIIYVLPFTSIIEQNAAVFREVFAPLGDDLVVEHHSNLDPDAAHLTAASRLATENWDARLIVTTNVQFFESLHAAKPSACRKLHRFTRSVIILDEAQTLPLTLLQPCLRAVQELAAPGRYLTSIVLCTATQPAVEQRPDFKSGLSDVREIIRDRAQLFSTLRRVRVTDLGRTPLPDAELADRLAEHPQVLCIVNTRRHAAELFARLPADGSRRHLSALMCPAHRSTVLGDPRNPAPGTLRHALRNDLPCRVVTTQLIEAGVDVDFPVVYRALAGLDSIAQAAGRCNREGRLPTLGDTFVFTPEPPIPRGFLRKSADSAAEILPLHTADPLCPAAIEAFFRLHYWKNEDQTDAKHILDCFPSGSAKTWQPADLFGFRFRDCAERFRFIDSNYQAVLVPYGDHGRDLIEELRATYDPAEQRKLARRLQRYVVQLPAPVTRLHLGRGLSLLHERYLILDDSHAYSDDLGLQLVTDRIYDPEQLIVS
ncbi:CRISPR-associated endonuclease Cas3'' [Horticoccus sp. 23ND18S-11]|uniref:CRISPR-associated endonuclease Cas3'' n=1 Tax=Horticoccus sp. 23ND18S-11 TaxID=3391832 RepID=UPI0039C8F3BB